MSYLDGGQREGQNAYVGTARAIRDAGNAYAAPGGGMPLRKSVCWIPNCSARPSRTAATSSPVNSVDSGSPVRRSSGSKPAPTPGNPLGAPPLNWWVINTSGYQGAHFATFDARIPVESVAS